MDLKTVYQIIFNRAQKTLNIFPKVADCYLGRKIVSFPHIYPVKIKFPLGKKSDKNNYTRSKQENAARSPYSQCQSGLHKEWQAAQVMYCCCNRKA
jgi:hypothetical protein